MRRIFYKRQEDGIEFDMARYNNFITSVLFSLVTVFLFDSTYCAEQPVPIEATDPYSVGDNEYLDGESKLLILDTESLTIDDESDVDWDGQNIYIKGNVYFKAANGKTLNVNIGGGNASGDYVCIQPFAKRIIKKGTTPPVLPDLYGNNQTNDEIDVTKDYAHLCFCPDAGGTIEVNLYKDLFLTGSNYSQDGAISITSNYDPNNPVTIDSDMLSTDLTISFTGQGQTIFRFADGKSLIMDTMKWDKDSGSHVTENIRDGINSGVRVFVAMDQDRDEVVVKGRNKVVFRRMSYDGGDNNNVVRVGRNSVFTFVSKNIDGLDSTEESYAAVAFDVSNLGEGRFELQITGSDNPGTYVDGSMQICGSFLGWVDDSNPANPQPVPAKDYSNPFDFLGIDPSLLSNDFGQNDFTGVDFSQPAGSQAFLRVIDNLAYEEDVDYAASLNPESGEVGFKEGGDYTRRGLLIVNNNFSIPPFASNPYGDSGWFSTNTSQGGINLALPYRPGFILGVNGHIEVSHNTFLEYEALSPNIELDPKNNGFTELDSKLKAAGINDPGTVFKRHNPSAMIIDGLETILRFENPNDNTPLNPPVPLIHFKAHTDDSIVRHAQMTLYGNASFTCRAPLLDNQGVYDGFRVPVPDEVDIRGNVIKFGETPGEGVHVMDIEGLFSIRSVDDNLDKDPDGFGRHATSGHGKAGVFRLGSLFRTFDDRETESPDDLNPKYVTRPLVEGKSYSRYDKPVVFTNASFDFIDIDFHNEDITRDVIADPLQADPVFVGGEKATFKSDVDFNNNPDITFWRIYNSRIHCHESMCISGIRLLVRELPSYLSETGKPQDNVSSIIFYNHGHAMDTFKKGSGRVFMFGTNNNEVAAGGTSKFLDSAYLNIFRHTGRVADLSVVDDFKNHNVVLKLQTQPEVPSGVSQEERSMHMMILGNSSYMDIGWTSTHGILKDKFGITVYPFDHFPLTSVPKANQFLVKTNSVNDDGSIDDGEKPAELNIDGDFIFFGARDSSGRGSPRTVDDFNLGRVIYVGHGGKMSIGSDLTVADAPRPYISFSDATIATRVWKDVDGQRGLNAVLELPGDQMKLSNPIHPYDLDMKILTDSESPYLSFKALAGKGLGSEVRIAWDKVVGVPVIPTASISGSSIFAGTRAISAIKSPVIMPSQGLVMMGAGDSVDQLTISGATSANPFRFYMTGSDSGISQIREIASVSSDTLVPGEGDYAKIFMDKGARLGLGTRHWNKESLGSWSRIGLSQVTLHPNGDCKIDVNSDLLVFDPQPIIPTENFGSQYEDKVNNVIVSPEHRITFYAQDSKEIRVPAGKELDLSAFGHAKELTGAEITGSATPKPLPPFTQQIATGGRVRLIFEPGSTLRFPDLGDVNTSPDDVAKMPVLYINEESELIFEAIDDLGNKPDWSSIEQTERAKIRILGCGQIWINKNARMRINNGAIVAVEADEKTPNTNITVSLQRESLLGIGDDLNPGGTLQIGNPVNIPGTNIDFTLRLNGEGAQVIIGREGFLGFGVGTVDRDSSKVNNWTLSPLFNVRDVVIRNISGVISHNRIFDGDDREGSLMAIGPVGGQYRIELGESGAVVKGGGNLVYVHPNPSAVPFGLSIKSTAENLVGDSIDNGRYTLLAPSVAMKQVRTRPNGFRIDTVVEKITSGNSSDLLGFKVTAFDAGLLRDGIRFKAGPVDTFKLLGAGGVNEIKSQTPAKFVALGRTKFTERIGYVNGTQIVRTTSISMQPGNEVSGGLKVGALRVATMDAVGNPSSFTLVGRNG